MQIDRNSLPINKGKIPAITSRKVLGFTIGSIAAIVAFTLVILNVEREWNASRISSRMRDVCILLRDFHDSLKRYPQRLYLDAGEISDRGEYVGRDVPKDQRKCLGWKLAIISRFTNMQDDDQIEWQFGGKGRTFELNSPPDMDNIGKLESCSVLLIELKRRADVHPLATLGSSNLKADFLDSRFVELIPTPCFYVALADGSVLKLSSAIEADELNVLLDWEETNQELKKRILSKWSCS